ncbi:MAG: hypothetical protein R3288_13030, partial [Woeseiaceae bacterium]|nr:hypothetical protein [Woeseiaceae bacterium]
MSFRVTASILKQAGGKVRCGGCRNAFNALDFLSETKPEEPPQDDPSAALPELTPDPLDDDGVAVPKVMSPEQSAALLKTLDELAGDDIRLEDTGIEWRLLSDDEADDDESANDDEPSDADASQVDELLEVAPTEVDELLTASPSQVDAAELFDGSASIVESTEVFGGGDTEVDAADVFADATGNELRFDDNTGLPEDFDGDRAARTPRSAEPRPQIIEPRAHQETQVDIVFGEPDEWGELLDEVETVDDAMAADVPPPDLSEAIIEPEPSPGDSGMTLAQELDALDEGDSPLDIDTQFNLQAEALGIDTTGVHEDVAGEALEPDEPEGDDTSIDDDLIAAAFETEQATDDDESIPDSAESPEPEPAEAQVPAGDEDTDDDAPSDDVLAEIDIDTAVAAGAAADAGDESDDEATPDGRSGDESDDESDDASGDDAVAA